LPPQIAGELNWLRAKRGVKRVGQAVPFFTPSRAGHRMRINDNIVYGSPAIQAHQKNMASVLDAIKIGKPR
jgi:hypothetical protein